VTVWPIDPWPRLKFEIEDTWPGYYRTSRQRCANGRQIEDQGSNTEGPEQIAVASRRTCSTDC